MSIRIKTIIQALQWWLSHDIKHNANSVDGCVIKVKFSLNLVPIFSFDRYVSSVRHQNNDVSCGSWYYGKKDITALKAIRLPSEFQCLLWRLWGFHPTNKVHNQQRTWEEVDMCWQCWTDTSVMVLAYNSLSFLSYKLRKWIQWIFLFALLDHIYFFVTSSISVKLSLWTDTIWLHLSLISRYFFFSVVFRGWSEWSSRTACANWPLSSSCPLYPTRCRLPLSGSSSWTCLH